MLKNDQPNPQSKWNIGVGLSIAITAIGAASLCAYTLPRQARLHNLNHLIDHSVSIAVKGGKIGIGIDSNDRVNLFLIKPNDLHLRPHTFLLEGGCEILTPQGAGILVDKEKARELIDSASNSEYFGPKYLSQVQALSEDFVAHARLRKLD